MVSIVTPQLVQKPPVKGADDNPSLINFFLMFVPEITHTSRSFDVQTVSPVEEFDAHEFIITPFVLIVVCLGVLVPRGNGSTLTTAMSGVCCTQEPLGTYETTFLPAIRTDCEPAARHDPGGKAA